MAGPDAAVLYGQSEAIDRGGVPLGIVQGRPYDLKQVLTGKSRAPIPQPSAFIRRSALEVVGKLDEDLHLVMDTDLWLRLAEVGQLANLRESLITYRWALTGISGGRRAEQVAFSQEAVRRARQRRGLPALGEMPQRWIPRDKVDLMEQWARQAMVAGNTATAARYAWRVLLRRPSGIMARVFVRAVMLRVSGRLHTSSSMRGASRA